MERSEAQKQAEINYRKRTPKEVRAYRHAKSQAKSFITKFANEDDLVWLKKLINEKENK